VLIHGVGSNEEDLFGLAPYLDDRFLVVSVRAPLTLGPGAFGWYEISFTAEGLRHDAEGAKQGRDTAFKALGELVSKYDVDPARIFVMGFSQGAVLSLGIALQHPNAIAGAVIMSGHLVPEFVADTAPSSDLGGLPIFVAHGLSDSVLPIESGRQINEYLKRQPVNLTYREYPMAHTVSENSLFDIARWLSAQLGSVE
jgi:phospholipase/carboxylesterase